MTARFAARVFGTALVAATLLLAATAEAKTVKISGTHSSSQIQSACAGVGGDFYQNSIEDGGGYGCYNEDKGTAVHCSGKGTCEGYVPGRQVAGSDPAQSGLTPTLQAVLGQSR
jgi:hypothetical protein